MKPIEKVCDRLGSQVALAEILKVTPATVNQWCNGVRPIPVERCPDIERASAGAVSRRDLRPDDWHRIWPELIDAEHPAPVTEVGAGETAKVA